MSGIDLSSLPWPEWILHSMQEISGYQNYSTAVSNDVCTIQGMHYIIMVLVVVTNINNFLF
jgi:hypothetical protein